MDGDLALVLSEMRLTQTIKLLEMYKDSHPQADSLNEAVEAIRKARDIIHGIGVP